MKLSKGDKWRITVGVGLILFIILGGVLTFKLLKENSECQRNPFVYGAHNAYDQDMEIFCSCTPLDPKYNGFYFDKEGITISKQFFDTSKLSPNLNLTGK